MSKYKDWIKDDKLILLEAWARDGLSNEQIAENMGISESTFYEWKDKYPKFSESLKKNKEIVDIEVENAMHKKALGYDVPIKKAFKVKEVLYENGKKIKETEKIEYAEETMHIPADTTAQIYWLKHRQREKWGEKESPNNNDVNERITNIANLLNNPQPNRSDDDVQ